MSASILLNKSIEQFSSTLCVSLACVHSIWEVEIVIGVSIILTLSQNGPNKVESCWHPRNAEPDTHSVVHDDTLHEESLESTEEEVIEPLLGGVGAMMEDGATGVWSLLVVELLTVPVGPHGLGYSQTFAIGESHVAHIALLVVLKSASYTTHTTLVNMHKALALPDQLSLVDL